MKPFSAASCNAKPPWQIASLALGSAPCSNNNRTIAVWPFDAAPERGRRQQGSAAFASEGSPRSNSLTRASSPSVAAINIRYSPPFLRRSSRISGFSSFRHQRCSPNTAMTAGVRPLPLSASTRLPRSSRRRTIARLLAATARWSGALGYAIYLMNSFGLFIQERLHAIDIPFANCLPNVRFVDGSSVSLVDFVLEQLGDGMI